MLAAIERSVVDLPIVCPGEGGVEGGGSDWALAEARRRGEFGGYCTCHRNPCHRNPNQESGYINYATSP